MDVVPLPVQEIEPLVSQFQLKMSETLPAFVIVNEALADAPVARLNALPCAVTVTACTGAATAGTKRSSCAPYKPVVILRLREKPSKAIGRSTT